MFCDMCEAAKRDMCICKLVLLKYYIKSKDYSGVKFSHVSM